MIEREDETHRLPAVDCIRRDCCAS